MLCSVEYQTIHKLYNIDLRSAVVFFGAFLPGCQVISCVCSEYNNTRAFLWKYSFPRIRAYHVKWYHVYTSNMITPGPSCGNIVFLALGYGLSTIFYSFLCVLTLLVDCPYTNGQWCEALICLMFLARTSCWTFELPEIWDTMALFWRHLNLLITKTCITLHMLIYANQEWSHMSYIYLNVFTDH